MDGKETEMEGNGKTRPSSPEKSQEMVHDGEDFEHKEEEQTWLESIMQSSEIPKLEHLEKLQKIEETRKKELEEMLERLKRLDMAAEKERKKRAERNFLLNRKARELMTRGQKVRQELVRVQEEEALLESKLEESISRGRQVEEELRTKEEKFAKLFEKNKGNPKFMEMYERIEAKKRELNYKSVDELLKLSEGLRRPEKFGDGSQRLQNDQGPSSASIWPPKITPNDPKTTQNDEDHPQAPSHNQSLGDVLDLALEASAIHEDHLPRGKSKENNKK